MNRMEIERIGILILERKKKEKQMKKWVHNVLVDDVKMEWIQ